MARRFLTAMGLAALFCFAAQPAYAEAKAKKGKATKGDKGATPAVTEAAPPALVDPATVTEPKDKASAYYKRGKVRFDEGKFEDALADFLEAYKAMPNPAVYISISSAYEKLGNLPEAVAYLEKYVTEKPDAGNIVSIKEKLAALKATPGKATIVTDPPGASITLDGETTDLVTPAELDLAGGDHAIALSMGSYIMETKAFTVPVGGTVTVEVKLTPVQSVSKVALPPPEEKPDLTSIQEKPEKKKTKVSPAVWAMTGVAGAGLVSATVFGLLALSEQASFDDDPSKDKKDKGEAFALACDVSWGVAAAAAIAGTVIYFVDAKKKKKAQAETQAIVSPIIAPDMAGAAVTVVY